jgi:hypothetical protein
VVKVIHFNVLQATYRREDRMKAQHIPLNPLKVIFQISQSIKGMNRLLSDGFSSNLLKFFPKKPSPEGLLRLAISLIITMF